jgi:RNA polymerase sigma-70 factor (ECF subfamily)
MVLQTQSKERSTLPMIFAKFKVVEGGVTEAKIDSRKKDLRLAQKISEGDEAAMRQVYDLYSGPLFHFTRSWLADTHAASDVVHETMLEVWKRADRFQGKSSLKSWMFSIARNKSIDQNRKASRMVYTDEDMDNVDVGPIPDEALSNVQDTDIIQKAILKLSDTHKRMIHLAFYEDLTYKEIAEIEGCPVGTVKTRILHAKKLLVKDLSQIKAR